MSRNGCTSMVLLLTGIVAAPSVETGLLLASPQSSGTQAPVQERLNRIAGDVFVHLDRIDDTIRELHAILALDPRSAEAHMLLGNAYVGKGSRDLMGEAIAEFRQALELNPTLVAARLYLAGVYLTLGRNREARDELDAALVQLPGQPQFLASLGEAERRLGNPRRSVELIHQALQADASLADARYTLGLALLDLGQRDEAIQEIERVVQSGANVADVYLSLGTAYLDAGRLEKALGALRQAAKVAPSRPDIRIQLARAFRTKGLLNDAQGQLALVHPAHATMIQDPTFYQQVQVGLNLEQGLIRLQQGRLAEATTALQKALAMDPNHGPTHRYLAEVYLRRGLYARSLEEATQAEKLGVPLPADQRHVLDEKLRTGARGGK